MTTATEVIYQFWLELDRESDCFQNGYKYGNCCNQTITNIAISTVDTIELTDIGNATLTTHDGIVMPVNAHRPFGFKWGVQFWPIDVSQGRAWEPSLYVTNFTVGAPWMLSIPIKLTANPRPSLRQWPCKTSRYLPTDAFVCDIQINGYQTLQNSPNTILNLNDYETPACCPEGILRFGRDDSCCVDNLADNPYHLVYDKTIDPGLRRTVFSFSLEYHGSDAHHPSYGGLVDPTRPNCTVTDVDQVELYVDNQALDYIYNVDVDGHDVDWVRSSDGFQSWIRVINLHKVSKKPSILNVYVEADVQADMLCTMTVAASPLCQYVLRGSYDTFEKEFMCCPRGAMPVAQGSCPAWD